MEPTVIFAIIAATAISFALVLWCKMLNRLTQLSAQVNQAIGTLSAQLQQRFDLIPDVLESARTSVRVQREYLDKLLEVRQHMHARMSPMDLGSLPPDIAPLMASGIAASAGKPGLESNPKMNVKAWTELQRVLHDTEKDVSGARRFYAAAVTEYNIAVRSVPTAIVASVHGFLPLPEFQISSQQKVKPDYGIGNTI